MRRITVVAKPGSSLNKVLVLGDDQYVVYTKERAIGGKANQEIILTLAKHLLLKKYQLKIVFGLTAREKIIEIED